MMVMFDDGDDFRRTQQQMKKSLQPQRQVQLHTFLVCPRSHLHAMLRQRISSDTELYPQAGLPAEPSATGAATAETMPAAAPEQPQELILM